MCKIFPKLTRKAPDQIWPHTTHFERKNSRPDILILTAYKITPTTILKHVFHETTQEEVFIRIFILKVNASKLKNKLDFYQTKLL